MLRPLLAGPPPSIAALERIPMDTASPSFAQIIHDLSIVRPWVLRSALATGLFERLAEEPRGRAELAEDLSCDPAVFSEVVGYLAAIGYVDLAEERVSVTEFGRALAQLPRDLYEPGSPMLIFDRAASELGSAWSHGAPVASRRALSYWEEVAQSPEACTIIGRYQPRTVLFDGAQLVSAIAAELGSASSSVLDLGGSNGALARDLSKVHGGPIGVLDLPEMIPNARENLSDISSDRVAFHGGSFFDPVPTGYDVYVLNSILYDYPDQQVRQLLTGIHDSLPEHAVLVVSEAVLAFPDAYTQAESTLMLTLNTGGRSRSAEDVATGAAAAGFPRPRRVHGSEQRYTVVFDH